MYKLQHTICVISKFRLDLPTFNALAILFCIELVFDYTLQPVLVKGTGQALNCYNCQTCVGVCPIKVVDGEPYPMTMILAARLGDYEKVKYLSKFCVACSRCAGKCPVGDSGPSIAAAANAYFINPDNAIATKTPRLKGLIFKEFKNHL